MIRSREGFRTHVRSVWPGVRGTHLALGLLLAASGSAGTAAGQGAGSGDPLPVPNVRVGEVRADRALVWVRLTAREPLAAAEGVRFARDDEAVPDGRSIEEMQGAWPGAAGEVRLSLSREDGVAAERPAGAPGPAVPTAWMPVEADRDHTLRVPLAGLLPGSAYTVRVEARRGGATGEASFRTAPAPDAAADLTFTVITGQDYSRRDDGERGHRIYRAMPMLDPDFFVLTGDTVYYDKPGPFAKTVELARFKWQRIFGLPNQRAFLRRVPTWFLKDDHDTLKNDCWPGQRYGSIDWQGGLELFREQVPMADGQKPYRTLRWGRHAQVWFLEGREFRSPNRRPDGPDKTILGAEQWDWLRETAASDATFKICVSATPIVGPDRKNKNDNHANAGFATEGARLRRFLADHGFVVVCGDRHWQYVSRDPETGLREWSCGPTSDRHAGGFRASDRAPHQSYLAVRGGFLQVSLDVEGRPGPGLRFVHRGVDGQLLHEVVLRPSDVR